MQERKKFYITTPIYYPSDKLHIGHCYTTVAADAQARYHRMLGEDVMFLTGTDEHGQKIERIANEQGIEPKAFVDQIVAWVQKLWKTMDISYDDFIRTTDERHQKAVQKIFAQLYEQGDIYKSAYEGKYCAPCETFWLERQLVDGKCPDCGREVELVQEESYFFKLSKYAPRLIQYIEDHPDFIQPVSRRNEMLNNFLLPGLEDLAVSRTSFQWGIPVPFDPKHVIYVWVDALSNYITALGYGSEDTAKLDKFWPANVHLVGKEIVRFHTIIWPIMLMALGLELPKQVFGHGWLLLDGGKMSKSKGNVIDPMLLCERYGVDSVRYFLLRDVPFGADGVYSESALVSRINSDLANDLGNLLSRTVAMIEKYFGSQVPQPGDTVAQEDDALLKLAEDLPSAVQKRMEALDIPEALHEIWKLVGACNKYIDVTMPWVLAKDEQKRSRLATVLYNLADCLRIISVMVSPYLTQAPARMREQLGLSPAFEYAEACSVGLLQPGTKVNKGAALFERIDPKTLDLDAQQEKKPEQQKQPKKNKKQEKLPEGVIGIEDFAKVQLRTGQVLECEALEGSDKLLKLSVQVGDAVRSIVSGIRPWYKPEEVVGRTVVVVANLKKAKLRGVVSEGMILCADDGKGNLSLVTLAEPLEGNGHEVR